MKKICFLYILSTLILTSCTSNPLFNSASTYPEVNVPVNVSTGNIFTSAVTYLAVHNNKVHVGTKNLTHGAEIYIFDSSTNLIKVLDPAQAPFNALGWGGGNYPYISSMYSYAGRLYAGVYSSSGAKLFATVDDSSYPYTWEEITVTATTANTPSFDAMITYNLKLFVGLSSVFGTGDSITIYYSATGNDGDFTQRSTAGTWASSSDIITNFVVYNDQGTDSLFLASEKNPSSPSGGCEVWRYNPGGWQARVNNDGGPGSSTYGALSSGFAYHPSGGYDDNIGVPSMLVVGTYLYMGVKNITTGGSPGNPNTGCKIWRTDDPATDTAYEEVVNNGFGDIDNISIDSMVYFKGYIYAFTRNSNGTEMWRSLTGSSGTWQKRNENGFGDSTNDSGRAVVVHNGVLYIGLEKETGVNGATIIQYGAAP